MMQRVEIDLVLTEKPKSVTFNGKEYCYFKALRADVDPDTIPDTNLEAEIFNVFESGNHAKYSLIYLDKDSLCKVSGELGYSEAINSEGKKYLKKSIKVFTILYKSYSASAMSKMNQAMFDHFANTDA